MESTNPATTCLRSRAPDTLERAHASTSINTTLRATQQPSSHFWNPSMIENLFWQAPTTTEESPAAVSPHIISRVMVQFLNAPTTPFSITFPSQESASQQDYQHGYHRDGKVSQRELFLIRRDIFRIIRNYRNFSRTYEPSCNICPSFQPDKASLYPYL